MSPENNSQPTPADMKMFAHIQRINAYDEAFAESDRQHVLPILQQGPDWIYLSLKYFPEELKKGFIYAGVYDASFPESNEALNFLRAQGLDNENDVHFGMFAEQIPMIDWSEQKMDLDHCDGRARPLFIRTSVVTECFLKEVSTTSLSIKRFVRGRISAQLAVAETEARVRRWTERGNKSSIMAAFLARDKEVETDTLGGLNQTDEATQLSEEGEGLLSLAGLDEKTQA